MRVVLAEVALSSQKSQRPRRRAGMSACRRRPTRRVLPLRLPRRPRRGLLWLVRQYHRSATRSHDQGMARPSQRQAEHQQPPCRDRVTAGPKPRGCENGRGTCSQIVIWVTYFRPDGRRRTVTDACGLLRTLASWPTRAAGVCIWQASAAQWIPEPGEGRRRCRAESPGAPAKLRSPSRYGTCLPAGFRPRPLPHRLKQAPDICFLGDQGKQGPTVAERVGGASTPAANDDASRRGPHAAHPHGRRVTMDKRLCRSVRRSAPDDWRGVATARHRHG